MDESGNSKALRVLFVNRMASLERGGGETFDLEISRHLAQAGVQVSFLSGAPLFGPPPMPVAGAQVLHTPWLRWFPWDKVKGGWRLRHAEFDWFVAFNAEVYTFEVKCDVDDIFLDTSNGGKLVGCAFDTECDDCATTNA